MDTLDAICIKKREHIATRKANVSPAALEARIREQAPPRGFRRALKEKVAAGDVGLIAEIKKASPSRGVIRADFAPPTLAKAYAAGGATCLSVLTDTPYFQGKDEDLVTARAAVPLPVLRKDFMLDPYQIAEARAIGADCVLLIISALAMPLLKELETAALELGMDVLVEVHDEKELETALTYLASPLIGINNRDLKTLKVDLTATKRLAPRIPASYTVVCESGIATHDDIMAMRGSGVSCFLVGESLMRQADVTAATRALLGL